MFKQLRANMLQTAGDMPKYVDEAFEDHVKSFEIYWKDLQSLQKEVTAYLQSLRGWIASGSKVAIQVSTMRFNLASPNYMAMVKLVEAHQQLFVSDEIMQLKKKLLVPINTLLEVEFPSIKEKIKERKNLMADFQLAKYRFQSITEKEKDAVAKGSKNLEKIRERRNELKQKNQKAAHEDGKLCLLPQTPLTLYLDLQVIII